MFLPIALTECHSYSLRLAVHVIHRPWHPQMFFLVQWWLIWLCHPSFVSNLLREGLARYVSSDGDTSSTPANLSHPSYHLFTNKSLQIHHYSLSRQDTRLLPSFECFFGYPSSMFQFLWCGLRDHRHQLLSSLFELVLLDRMSRHSLLNVSLSWCAPNRQTTRHDWSDGDDRHTGFLNSNHWVACESKNSPLMNSLVLWGGSAGLDAVAAVARCMAEVDRHRICWAWFEIECEYIASLVNNRGHTNGTYSYWKPSRLHGCSCSVGLWSFYVASVVTPDEPLKPRNFWMPARIRWRRVVWHPKISKRLCDGKGEVIDSELLEALMRLT